MNIIVYKEVFSGYQLCEGGLGIHCFGDSACTSIYILAAQCRPP